jgi:hypothetical protein
MRQFLNLIEGAGDDKFFPDYYGRKLLLSHPGQEKVQAPPKWQTFNNYLDNTSVQDNERVQVRRRT